MMDRTSCERCGRAIPDDAPGGDCPSCLLEAGLQFDPDTGERTSALDRDEVARRFPKLEVLELIGRGGMGVVYRARQKSLNRTVALKILSPALTDRPDFAERFAREARSLALLDHPNVVRVLEAGREGELCYLLMEHVDGTSLRSAMQAGLKSEQALRIVSEICDALQYAHDHGVVHRDVKPENILLDRQGRVKIADFGLAKVLGGSHTDVTLTQRDQVMGTLHYMAPEQMRGTADVDHRADIFSLGVVFYEMLTGSLPVGRFPPPSHKVEIDVRLDEVVLRALENERDQRYQRIDQVKTGVHSVQSHPTRRVAKPRQGPVTSGKAILGFLGVPAAVVLGALVLLVGLDTDQGRGNGAVSLAALLIGLTVVIVGMVLSGLARGDIARNPELRGRGLATAGLIIPCVFAVLMFLVLPVLFLGLRPEPAVDSERAAAEAMLYDLEGRSAVDAPDLRLRLEAEDLMSRLSSTLEAGRAYFDLYDPGRGSQLSLKSAAISGDWDKLGPSGDLNLPAMVQTGGIDLSRLRLSASSPIQRIEGGRGFLRLESLDGDLFAPIVEVDEVWYFCLEALTQAEQE